ncbi:MAG TPA: cyclic nucleotide-binding domain-containing protein [Steroidobacteraceae bacterium]|nr:cyclic nucleotide-binding domain-containing protein [Steroidobacteraceae bacterium]
MNLADLFRFETGGLTVAAGQPLFRAGEAGNIMYVLMKGTAVVTVGDLIVEHAEPGAILGELALIEQVPRSATVTAATECNFIPIDAKRFQFLIQQTPNFALHVMKVMADRLRKTDQLLLAARVGK